MVMVAVFTDEERTMSGLLPVARSARPRFVLRKNERKSTTSITAARAMMSLY